jgi:hypothetical protein
VATPPLQRSRTNLRPEQLKHQSKHLHTLSPLRPRLRSVFGCRHERRICAEESLF